MPRRRRGKKDHQVATEASSIDAVPDVLLEHILGFLPAEEAVRTCVLARRWRHLWKSATGLRITSVDGEFLEPVSRLREFLGRLLRDRGGSPLDFFELRFGDWWDTWSLDEDLLDLVDEWFWHALGCNVRVLKFDYVQGHEYHELHDLPLVSRHLTKLELCGVELNGTFLNFSSCPNLEHLEFHNCTLLWASIKNSFEYVKHLRISQSRSCLESDSDLEVHIRIDAPNLVSLVLDDPCGRTPILESMPSLVEASISLIESQDYCKLWNANYMDCDCVSCAFSDNIGGGNNNSVVLEGLSEAKSLVLVSKPTTYIFKRDLRSCPTFSKLKNLWLNDYWCVHDDFRALVCILEHSPVLEKLTLQLFSEGPKYKLEMEGSVSPTERSAAFSKHLKTVEVKCKRVDKRVLKVLQFLHVSNLCDLQGNSLDTLFGSCAKRGGSATYKGAMQDA